MHPSVKGNIAAYNVSVAFSSSLTVKNLAAFAGGQDERYYAVVQHSDIANAAAALQASMNASITAALHGQIVPGEQLHTEPCSPVVTADHQTGDEASTVTVTVSQTCSAVVYNSAALTAQAEKLISMQGSKAGISGFLRSGDLSVQVTRVTVNQQTTLISFTAQATYLFQLTLGAEQGIRERIAGESRLTALRQLAAIPGIQRASISGLRGDQLLPDDPQHIYLLVIFLP